MNELEKKIKYYSDSYYNTGESLISDKEFDELYEKLDKNILGSIPRNNKIKLPFIMGSLVKLKNNKQIENWKKNKYDTFDKINFNKLNISENEINILNNKYLKYTISEKLDGVSALIYNNNGVYKMYSRGNGIYGKDISHLLPSNIKIPKNWAIRGELIISKENFKKFKNASNARNTVSGIINLKKLEKNNNIDFICFGIVYPIFQLSRSFELLKYYKINTVNHIHLNNINEDILLNILKKWKKESKYEIDGIVCEYNCLYNDNKEYPKNAFAFKSNTLENFKNTIIQDIEWNLSKSGYLKPIIIIDEIIIDNITIKKITGHNAKYIYSNNLGKNSEIQVTRSGGVIPYISKIIKSTEPLMPKTYLWNDTKVDIYINDDVNDDVILKRNEYFFKTLDINFIGIGILNKLKNNNFINLFDILNGFKNNSFEKIIGKNLNYKIKNEIEYKISLCNLNNLMDASRIFGNNIGEKKINKLLEKYPNILKIKINESDLNDIYGFQEKTSIQFLNGINEFKKFYNNLNKIYTLKNNIQKNNKYNIVFTGFRNKKYENYLISKGYSISNNITKETKYVIYEGENQNSLKIKKANEKNIPVIKSENIYKVFN